MARGQSSQQQRTAKNPLVLGTFDVTSLRLLTGTLGPLSQVVGRADTNQYSNGGYGNGCMNHWFQINLAVPAWIITRKGNPRPNYIQVSAYDLNHNPIEGRMIFQADSISTTNANGDVFYPYLGHVMGAGSDLYNTFERLRLDKGNDLYFPLETGSYLICVASTRNERLDYTLGLVIEVPTDDMFLLLADFDENYLIQETALDLNNTIIIGPVFASNYTLATNFNAYTFSTATINSGVTVTIPTTSTWYVGFVSPESNDKFSLEGGPGYDGSSIHEHSRTEWTDAWQRERSPNDSLPDLFVPLVNR
jgi:hypothetical protein